MCYLQLDHNYFSLQQKLYVAIYLMIEAVNTQATDEQKQAVFKTSINSLLFDKTPIAERNSDSLTACSRYCTRNKLCQSANFIKNKTSCSLLNKTQNTHPQLLLRKQVGGTYLEKVAIKDIIIFFYS